MKKEPIIVNVYLWGTCIGKLNWDFEKHCSVFQFTDEYRKQDYDICPSTHLREPLCLRLSMGIKINYIKGFRNFLQMRFLTNGGLPYLTNGSRIII